MTTMTLQQAMEAALAMHRAGQLEQAEAAYRHILTVQPRHHKALQSLGLLYYQAGHPSAAIQCIDGAIAMDAGIAEYHLNRGAVLDRLNRTPDAIDAFRKALALNPRLPEAYANLGAALRKTGNLTEAAAACRMAIECRPDYVDGYLNLGNVLQDQRDFPAAIAAYERVVSLRPDSAEGQHNLGNAYVLQGRHDQAIAAQRAALRIKPDFAEAANALGASLRDRALAAGNPGNLDESIDAFRQAIDVKPDFATALMNLGLALRQKAADLDMKSADKATELIQEAIRMLALSLQIAPDVPEAHLGLGMALQAASDSGGAILAYRQAVKLRPQWDLAHCLLGRALAAAGDFPAATTALQQSLALNPELAEAHHRLGLLQSVQGDFDQSMHHLRRAAQLAPQSAEIATSVAIGLCNMGDIQAASDQFNRVLELDPSCAVAHWNLGLMRLTHGDFTAGWPEYEWRWRVRELDMSFNATAPLWDGADLAGKQILILCEQGMGDMIQFIRYLPLVAERGGNIALAAPQELIRLFKGSEIGRCVQTWITPGDALPAYDVYCPLLTLPKIFATTLETIPAKTPYLSADDAIAANWKSRIPSDHRLKVGIAWAGKPKHINDRNRSIPGAKLAPLANAKNIWFCSLQKGPIAKPDEKPSLDMADWSAELNDFADTAAIIANLDLVICADTAVAHLAGAMGKRVWVMIPYLPDWRWLLNRNDSPWYPTMRLFRQPRPGDWESVLEQVAAELDSLK